MAMVGQNVKCPCCHVGLHLTFYSSSSHRPFTHRVFACLGGRRDNAQVVAATCSKADADLIAAALAPEYTDCTLVIEAIDKVE